MAYDSGSALIAQMDRLEILPGSLAIWGLGQMGVALKGGKGGLIYIDPVLTDVVAIKIPSAAEHFRRAFPPPLEPEQITNARLVLCTHDHLDHTDPLTLGPICHSSLEAQFAAPRWADESFAEAEIPNDRRLYLSPGVPMNLGEFTITAIPSAHYEIQHTPELGYRFFSYLVEWNGVRFFHSGDTLLTQEYEASLRKLNAPHVVMLAANGRDARREREDVLGNLQPAEAVWLAQTLGADVLIGGHNDLFLWNALPAGDLANAVERIHPRQKFLTLQPGQLFYYVSPTG